MASIDLSLLSDILSLHRPVRDQAEESLVALLNTSSVNYVFVKSRLKLDSGMVEKINEGKQISEIFDIVGTRIVVHYVDEIETVSSLILKHCHNLRKLRRDGTLAREIYNVAELPAECYEDYIAKPRGKVGYRSLHLVVFSPIEVPGEFAKYFPRRADGLLFAPVEIQLRTILLHAWEEKDWHYNYRPAIAADPFIQGQFYSIARILWHIDHEFMGIKEIFRDMSRGGDQP